MLWTFIKNIVECDLLAACVSTIARHNHAWFLNLFRIFFVHFLHRWWRQPVSFESVSVVQYSSKFEVKSHATAWLALGMGLLSISHISTEHFCRIRKKKEEKSRSEGGNKKMRFNIEYIHFVMSFKRSPFERKKSLNKRIEWIAVVDLCWLCNISSPRMLYFQSNLNWMRRLRFTATILAGKRVNGRKDKPRRLYRIESIRCWISYSRRMLTSKHFYCTNQPLCLF